MRYLVCLVILFLGAISAVQAQDSKISQISLTLTDKKTGTETCVTIANDGSATLTSTNSEPRKLGITASQCKKLFSLISKADISHINSIIVPYSHTSIKVFLSIIVDNKNYTIAASLGDYGDFDEQLDPIMDFLLNTPFKVINEKEGEF